MTRTIAIATLSNMSLRTQTLLFYHWQQYLLIFKIFLTPKSRKFLSLNKKTLVDIKKKRTFAVLKIERFI